MINEHFIVRKSKQFYKIYQKTGILSVQNRKTKQVFYQIYDFSHKNNNNLLKSPLFLQKKEKNLKTDENQ